MRALDRNCRRLAHSLLLVILTAPAMAQLRVATWNITNYSGGRTADIQTAVYGVFSGRTFAPDVLMAQEVLSASAQAALLSALDNAAGGPGDWAMATFVDGPDTDSSFFYRTSKVSLVGQVTVAVGGVSPNHPRNIMRYDVRLAGYDSAAATLACYSSHMKAQESGSDDDNRRRLEAQRIRDNAETLPAGWNFVLGADFNIQNSASLEYQDLVGSQVNDAGRFFDPINTPGTWNNNGAFRYVHTQDPVGAGGMDDRYDQLLVSSGLRDGDGFDYLGNSAIPYSTVSWSDTNHSYRCWGNDGTSFNLAMTITNNQMVGTAIAQAIANSTGGSAGHLPVFADFRVPPLADAPATLDFGQVPQDEPAELVLTVTNSGDTALWTANGISPLVYSLSATAGFTAPGGSFNDAAGGGGVNHLISMDTSAVGPMSGTLTITSNAPESPTLVVSLVGEVIGAGFAPGDVNCDGAINVLDINPFTLALSDPVAYAAMYPGCDIDLADVNGDGNVDVLDINPFIALLSG
ncbi:hypothetical protein RAS1_11510 [Phycisphaerae bacterium RAS1]|nr:hypothetical protein RAS1_11510 [Phycisphaerae bacterium RAS1]